MMINIEHLRQALDPIANDLFAAAHMDNVFWQVQSIIAGNPAINRNDVFQEWIADTYVDSMAIRLRRLVDTNRNSRSLFRFLDNMKTLSGQLTRSWYLSRNDRHSRDLSNRWFDQLAGHGAHLVSLELIEDKKTLLQSATARVCTYTNQHVAHYARTQSTETILFSEVRRSLAEVFLVFNWCAQLLLNSYWATPVPYPQTNWTAVFRVPWLGEGILVPSYQHLDEHIKEVANHRLEPPS